MIKRRIFTYTQKDSKDKTVPIDYVIQQLNEEIAEDKIISIKEELHRGDYVPDNPWENTIGCRPFTATLIVYYREG